MNIASRTSIRKAIPRDLAAVIALLQKADLPTADLPADLSHFFVAEADGEIIASAGLEIFGQVGLLRSVAVGIGYRKRSLGTRLVDKLLAYATAQGIEAMYLITTTAEDYFGKRGFKTLNRENVPGSIKSTSEFSTTCPSTATVMVKTL